MVGKLQTLDDESTLINIITNTFSCPEVELLHCSYKLLHLPDTDICEGFMRMFDWVPSCRGGGIGLVPEMDKQINRYLGLYS